MEWLSVSGPARCSVADSHGSEIVVFHQPRPEPKFHHDQTSFKIGAPPCRPKSGSSGRPNLVSSANQHAATAELSFGDSVILTLALSQPPRAYPGRASSACLVDESLRANRVRSQVYGSQALNH